MMYLIALPEEVFNDREAKSIVETLTAELQAEARTIGMAINVQETPAGMGATYPMIGVQFLLDNWEIALILAFFLGEKIERNSAAWYRMLRRLSSAVISLSKKRPGTPDARLEALLAINELRPQFESARSMRLCGAILASRSTLGQSHYVLAIKDLKLPTGPMSDLSYDQLLELRSYNTKCLDSDVIVLVEVDDRDLYAISRAQDRSVKAELLVSRP